MLTFRDKAEEDFWKATYIATVQKSNGAHPSVVADSALTYLRNRQPKQEFPVIAEVVI